MIIAPYLNANNINKPDAYHATTSPQFPILILTFTWTHHIHLQIYIDMILNMKYHSACRILLGMEKWTKYDSAAPFSKDDQDKNFNEFQ